MRTFRSQPGLVYERAQSHRDIEDDPQLWLSRHGACVFRVPLDPSPHSPGAVLGDTGVVLWMLSTNFATWCSYRPTRVATAARHRLRKVEQAELQAVTSLIMALEEMHKTARRCRAVELRRTFPVQMIFAALYRMESRGVLDIVIGDEDGPDARGRKPQPQVIKDIRDLQVQCIDVQNRWTKNFHPYGLSRGLMRTIAGIYSGVPIPGGYEGPTHVW
ncbi:hypothetical protein RBB50_012010 [Rhinocladiella similis]